MQIKELFAGAALLASLSLFAGTFPADRKKENGINNTDSIKIGIDFLKKHLQPSEVWQVGSPDIVNSLNGLIHYTEDEPIDTVLYKLEKFNQTPGFRYITRAPQNLSDSLQIKGYQPYPTILERMKQLDRAIWNGVNLNSIPLNENLTAGPDGKVPPISEGDEEAIIRRTFIQLPDSLKNVNALPENQSVTSNNFERIKERQKIRSAILENARQKFNAQIAKMNLDSAITAYRQYAVKIYSDSLQNQLKDSLKTRNQFILTHYNDSIVKLVNDSISQYVKILQRHAINDSVSVSIQSLSGKPSQIWLQNNKRYINRMFIKNQ